MQSALHLLSWATRDEGRGREGAVRAHKNTGEETCHGAHFLSEQAARSRAAFQRNAGGTRPVALGSTGLSALDTSICEELHPDTESYSLLA